jgi:glycine cleavage system transcriptional repressor
MIALKQWILTGAGPDQHGLVAALTQALFQVQGNIEDSSMTRLAGHFATILVLSIPEAEDIRVFQAQLERLRETHGFSAKLTPVEKTISWERQPQETLPFMVTVAGHDKAGITYALTQALASVGANISDLNAHRISGEDGSVYILVLEADVPKGISVTVLRETLTPAIEPFGLDLKIRQLEDLSFS